MLPNKLVERLNSKRNEKYLKMNNNNTTAYQNSWVANKTVLKWELCSLNAYIRKEEKLK